MTERRWIGFTGYKNYAKKDGNQYTLNGSKIFITNGVADLIIVAAKTDQSAGAKGISLILLDANNVEGFSRGKPLKNWIKGK